MDTTAATEALARAGWEIDETDPTRRWRDGVYLTVRGGVVDMRGSFGPSELAVLATLAGAQVQPLTAFAFRDFGQDRVVVAISTSEDDARARVTTEREQDGQTVHATDLDLLSALPAEPGVVADVADSW